jgi:hypothetical protein
VIGADPGPIPVAYTVDYADIAAFAQVDLIGIPLLNVVVADVPDSTGSPCRTSGTTITCHRPATRPVSGIIASLGDFLVRPTAAAAPGDEGHIHVTTRVDGGAPIRTDGLVRIGEPVNLAAAGREPLSAAPGASVAVNPQVGNTGSFRNCVVHDVVICLFDTTLAPAHTYRLSRPIPLRVPRGAVAGSRVPDGAQWITSDSYAEWRPSAASAAAPTEPGRR